MTSVSFHVYGTPKPQGSKRHVGHGVMVESGGEALRTWREDVKHAALEARTLLALDEPLTGALAIVVTFMLARPKSHYRTGANAHLLRESAPTYPCGKPDLDKLLRSTFDAITASGLWADDARATYVTAMKNYAVHGSAPGARVQIDEMEKAMQR